MVISEVATEEPARENRFVLQLAYWTLLRALNEILPEMPSEDANEIVDSFTLTIRGRVDDLSFFEYLSPFCFLSIEFHCTFSISYKILPHFVYYYSILIRM